MPRWSAFWSVAALALALATAGCNRMGTKIEKEGCELYVKDVSKSKGEALLKLLTEEKVCDGSRKTMQLRKEDGTVEFRVVIKEGKEKDDAFLDGMKALGGRIVDEVMDGEDIDVHLCDDKMKTLKVIKPVKQAPEEEKPAKAASEDLKIPNSDVALTRPAAWSKTQKGDWGLLGAPDKKALLAFVVYTKPNESTTRLGQVASVLGASNIRWQSPKPSKVGSFNGQVAVGGCTFGGKPGAMAYAIVDTGTPRKVLVVYAVEEGASEQTKSQAKAIVSTLRPAR